MRMRKLGCLLAGMVILSIAAVSNAEEFADGLYATAGYWSGGWQPNEIIRFAPDGSWETAISLPSDFDNVAKGLAFLDRERLAVTLGGGPNSTALVGRLSVFDSAGSILSTVNGIPATNRFANGSHGWGFAVDSDGTYYITTHNTPGATKVTAAGAVSDWTGYEYDLWWGKDAVFSPSGDLYVTNGLEGGTPVQTGSIHQIDTQTGAMTTILEDIDWVRGIEFNDNGDMFFSQRQLSEVWRLDAGTTTPYAFASVPTPLHMTMSPDDTLYVIGIDTDDDYQIWTVDPVSGASTLFADNLPNLADLAFPRQVSVPEPSSVVLLCSLATLVWFFSRRRR